jgi:hypothetical protein
VQLIVSGMKRDIKAIDEFYPLIGKVVVRFQEIDMTLNMIMACLLKEDPNVTIAFMVTLPFSKKLDVLRSVAPFKFKFKILLDQLDATLPLISVAEDKRNRVVHATWISASDNKKVFFYKPRATRKVGMKDDGIRDVTPEEIKDALKAIDDALSAICRLGEQLERQGVMITKMFSKLHKPPGVPSEQTENTAAHTLQVDAQGQP